MVIPLIGKGMSYSGHFEIEREIERIGFLCMNNLIEIFMDWILF